MKECPACEGGGWIKAAEFQIQCSWCRGAGRVTEEKRQEILRHHESVREGMLDVVRNFKRRN